MDFQPLIPHIFWDIYKEFHTIKLYFIFMGSTMKTWTIHYPYIGKNNQWSKFQCLIHHGYEKKKCLWPLDQIYVDPRLSLVFAKRGVRWISFTRNPSEDNTLMRKMEESSYCQACPNTPNSCKKFGKEVGPFQVIQLFRPKLIKYLVKLQGRACNILLLDLDHLWLYFMFF